MFLHTRQTRSEHYSLVNRWVIGVCHVYQMNGQVINLLTEQADDEWCLVVKLMRWFSDSLLCFLQLSQTENFFSSLCEVLLIGSRRRKQKRNLGKQTVLWP